MRRLNKLRSVVERLAASPNSAAIDPAELRKLLAEDGAAGDRFGNSVVLSADGSTALIGAAFEKGEHDRAYVFVKGVDDTFSQQAKLITENYQDGMFGISSVSLSADGSIALIGAPNEDSYKGAAYIFAKTEDGTWSQQAKLTVENNQGYPFVGCSVSLSADGNSALLGAFCDGNFSNPIGAAYVFAKGTDGSWSQQAKLTAKDVTGYTRFGLVVSLSADSRTALIGAPLDAGAVYIFTKSEDGTWSQQAKLTVDHYVYDFGDAISLSADSRTALIGSSGGLYIFAKTEDGTWNQQAKLPAAAQSILSSNFVSLSADGHVALIGASGDDDGDKKGCGSAYIFIKGEDSTWTQRLKLIAEDGATGDRFGSSVALSADGRTAMIGAPGDDDRSTDSGSVYVFSIPPANVSAPVSVMRLRR